MSDISGFHLSWGKNPNYLICPTLLETLMLYMKNQGSLIRIEKGREIELMVDFLGESFKLYPKY